MKPTIVVVIASLGRPEEVGDLIEELQSQTRTPDKIILSVTREEDLPPPERRGGAEIIMGEKGLPAQRNRGMSPALGEFDYLAFFDDDYLPSRYAIEKTIEYFEAHPDIVGITGVLLADGIKGPGISREDALNLIRQHDETVEPQQVLTLNSEFGLYGCNMAYRISAIENARFDEKLPLYAWQEDVDFAAQLLPRGRLVKTNAMVGVHRGVKGARTNGVKLGYSQIANPVYLMQKGTLRKSAGLSLMMRNLLANHVLTLRSEPWTDRWGRTRGNWLGIMHLLTGRLSPEHILKIR